MLKPTFASTSQPF